TTGRTLTAEQARNWGLVSELVRPDELPARAAVVAAHYAELPTRAVWETKRLLDDAQTATLEQQLEIEARAQAQLVKTDDFSEGVTAYFEQRHATFTGALSPIHPIRLVVTDDLRRWRLTVALRGVLVLPHLALLWTWSILAFFVWLVAWPLTFARGREPA